MTVILTESHFFEHLVGEEVKKMLRQTCFDVQDGEPLIILGSSLSFQDKWISHLTRLQTVTVKVVTSWRQMLEQTMKTHAVETLVRFNSPQLFHFFLDIFSNPGPISFFTSRKLIAV